MTQPAPTRESLKRDCYALIDAIAAHRYGIKLLIAAKRGLMLYASYKANRCKRCARFSLISEWDTCVG